MRLDSRRPGRFAAGMKTLAQTCALVGAAAVALPAAALPPPPPVAVTPIVGADANDGLLDDGHALRSRLIADNWFADAPSTLDRATLEACGREAAVSACVKPLTIASRGAAPAPEVVLLLRPTVGGLVEMNCMGPGDTVHNAERQQVVLNLKKALAREPAVGMSDRNAAVGCILAAAAESGW